MRSAATTAIGVGERLRGISKSGGTSMACGVWASPTPRTSMKLRTSRCAVGVSSRIGSESVFVKKLESLFCEEVASGEILMSL